MTVAVLPTRWEHLPADDRQAVLRAFVREALGRHAGKSTLTIDETAEVLGTGRSATYAAVHAGGVPACRVGRRLVVPVPALVALLLGLHSEPLDGASAGAEGLTGPAP